MIRHVVFVDPIDIHWHLVKHVTLLKTQLLERIGTATPLLAPSLHSFSTVGALCSTAGTKLGTHVTTVTGLTLEEIARSKQNHTDIQTTDLLGDLVKSAWAWVYWNVLKQIEFFWWDSMEFPWNFHGSLVRWVWLRKATLMHPQSPGQWRRNVWSREKDQNEFAP